MKEYNTDNHNFESNNLPESLRVNPFSVPDGYFSELSKQIINRRSLEDKIDKNRNPFITPEGYFTNLKERIHIHITAEKLRKGINEGGFHTPEGYFDTLSHKILEKVKKPEDITPSLKKEQNNVWSIKKWNRYLTAACLIIALGIGTYLMIPQQRQSNSVSFADITDDEIINYLVQSAEDDDILYLTHYFNSEDSENGDSPSGIGCLSKDEDIEDYINYTL